MKKLLKRSLERLLGARIYRVLPRGVDPFLDLARHLPSQRFEVIFDVGANTGQSARRFLDACPGARILSFEPAADTFERLQANLAGAPRAECFRMALGSTVGTGVLVHWGRDTWSFVEGQGSSERRGPDAEVAAATEPVELATLDQFTLERGVDRIDYLKIDTEGGDLDVLRGARRLLTGRDIDVVEVEAGMSAGNERHVPLERFREFLQPFGYELFGLYEQHGEWRKGEPQLRRVNAVFISPEAIERNRTEGEPAPGLG